jgi:hypothetical protein
MYVSVLHSTRTLIPSFEGNLITQTQAKYWDKEAIKGKFVTGWKTLLMYKVRRSRPCTFFHM